MNKIVKVFFLSGLILLSNCGFKVLNKSQSSNFEISQITTSGDKRLGYKLKNKLSFNTTKNSENTLLIDLNLKKIKEIKEKNIKNEITKYQITLNVDVQFNILEKGNDLKFKKVVVGDYLVGDIYSTTINNEKKLITNLIDQISKNILAEISIKVNDF